MTSIFHTCAISAIILLLPQLEAAPTKATPSLENTDDQISKSRAAKSLFYYDFLPQPDYIDEYSEPIDDTENEVLSRGSSSYTRRHNSPIYYIRLPPMPYMFVPGLGYISQPPSVSPLGPTTNPFINLPVSFISNGKPGNIYQWSSQYQPPVIPKPTPKPIPKPETSVHKLPGKFPFNGKPTDIIVLRDSYNSLYADALQNFYP